MRSPRYASTPEQKRDRDRERERRKVHSHSAAAAKHRALSTHPSLAWAFGCTGDTLAPPRLPANSSCRPVSTARDATRLSAFLNAMTTHLSGCVARVREARQ